MKSWWKKYYGALGLAIIVVMELMAIFHVPEMDRWVTPIGWYGYILLVDALVYRRQKTSLLMNHTKEFFIMLPISVALWCIFEFHNLLFHNWEYIGLHENMFVRNFGFAISFATILPALWETDELLKSWSFFNFRTTPRLFRRSRLVAEMVLGFICIGVATFFPSTYTGPLVWPGYLLVFSPLNYLLGIPSVVKEREEGVFTGTVTLCVAGLLCGLVWESLIFWAGAKWVYHVPYFPEVKIFEMPLLGFLGFAPFGILFIEMYRWVKHGPLGRVAVP